MAWYQGCLARLPISAGLLPCLAILLAFLGSLW